MKLPKSSILVAGCSFKQIETFFSNRSFNYWKFYYQQQKILTMLVGNCGAPVMPVVGWEMLYENKEFPGTGGWRGPAGICEFGFMAYTHRVIVLKSSQFSTSWIKDNHWKFPERATTFTYDIGSRVTPYPGGPVAFCWAMSLDESIDGLIPLFEEVLAMGGGMAVIGKGSEDSPAVDELVTEVCGVEDCISWGNQAGDPINSLQSIGL